MDSDIWEKTTHHPTWEQDVKMSTKRRSLVVCGRFPLCAGGRFSVLEVVSFLFAETCFKRACRHCGRFLSLPTVVSDHLASLPVRLGVSFTLSACVCSHAPSLFVVHSVSFVLV